jgi:hypothetical protein
MLAVNLHNSKKSHSSATSTLAAECFSVDLRRSASELLTIADKHGLALEPIKFGLLHPRFVAYDMAVRRLVNPDNRSFIVASGAAGAGASRLLLATDATRMFFIDERGVSAKAIQKALTQDNWDRADPKSLDYIQHKFNFGFCPQYNQPNSSARNLLTELSAVGVQKLRPDGGSNISVSELDGVISIEFAWRYPGSSRTKQRRIDCLVADLTEPKTYLPRIAALSNKKLDAYYQCASFELLNVAEWYLPQISRQMAPRSHLILDTRQNNLGLGKEFRLNSALNRTERGFEDLFDSPVGATLKRAFQQKLKYYGQAYRVLKFKD